MSKILIIEDDEAIAELERDYLEINGYSVDIVGDGEKGVEMALSGDYNLFIIDIMLPGKDGFEITKDIRSKKETPVLLVSARKEDIDKIRGLGLGADDYITKPFSPGELVARVKAHLARYERLIESTRKKNGDMLQIRDLRLDKKNMRVWVNEDEVKLTTKEFELLYFLAEHPDHIYSKEELFKEIWSQDSIGDIATVTVHVKKIRKKIELNEDKPQYIETIWGVGYRLKV